MKHNFDYSWQEQQERNMMTPLDRWVESATHQLIGACAMGIILCLILTFL